jgi:hypothetical protein
MFDSRIVIVEPLVLHSSMCLISVTEPTMYCCNVAWGMFDKKRGRTQAYFLQEEVIENSVTKGFTFRNSQRVVFG